LCRIQFVCTLLVVLDHSVSPNSISLRSSCKIPVAWPKSFDQLAKHRLNCILLGASYKNEKLVVKMIYWSLQLTMACSLAYIDLCSPQMFRHGPPSLYSLGTRHHGVPKRSALYSIFLSTMKSWEFICFFFSFLVRRTS
jgi:hypothetical protein